MTRRWASSRRGIVILVMAAVGLAGTSASADPEEIQITSLRADPVALFKCEDPSTPVGQLFRKDFHGPWTATKNPDRPMFLRVMVDSQPYCLKAHLVEAKTPVPATNAPKECKDKAGKPPKPGFNRGLGQC